MFRSRRVALAREALPSVTAWAELVMGADRAEQFASDAVVTAASARKVTTLPELTRAARDGLARTLAASEAAIPDERPTDKDSSGPDVALAVTPKAAADAYAPREDSPDGDSPDDASPHDASQDDAEASDHSPAPDHRTPADRLADALEALRPHERLAAVRFYLDGESADAVADLFGIARADSVALLESVTAILAPIVGEYDLPDFSAQEEEIDVVSR